MLLTTERTKKGTSVSKRVRQRDCETGGGREAEVEELATFFGACGLPSPQPWVIKSDSGRLQELGTGDGCGTGSGFVGPCECQHL